MTCSLSMCLAINERGRRQRLHETDDSTQQIQECRIDNQNAPPQLRIILPQSRGLISSWATPRLVFCSGLGDFCRHPSKGPLRKTRDESNPSPTRCFDALDADLCAGDARFLLWMLVFALDARFGALDARFGALDARFLAFWMLDVGLMWDSCSPRLENPR